MADAGSSVDVALGVLRMLENHLWTAEAGDSPAVGSGGVSDLLRRCCSDFDRISPLKPSTALCLHAWERRNLFNLWS